MKLNSFVSDFTNHLSSDIINEYNRKFHDYEKSNEVQIAVAFIENRN
jgi:uncharacterized membrane protein YgcG